MKVLLISKIYPSATDPDFGVFITNIERSIIDKGGIVYRSVVAGRVESRLAKLYKYFVFCLGIYKNLLTKDIDLIYVHFANHSLIPLLPIYRFSKIPIVINAHGGDIEPAVRKNARLIGVLTRNMIKRAALLIVPSNYYRDVTARLYPDNVIHVSPSGGVDLALFKPAESPSEQRATLNIGYVSRLDTCKGWDVLLKALSWIKRHHPQLSFHAGIAGFGADYPRFQAMVESLGLERQLTYHGLVKQPQLPEIYRSFDLFVFPTIRPEESLGLVGLEAMACGLPVIGSRIGGLPEYIRDGSNGYLFAAGDHRELAQKIIAFGSLDSGERRRMRECARDTASRYGRERVADELYAALQETLDAKSH